MKIGVASLGPAPIELEATESPEDIGLDAEHASFPHPVHVAVKATRMQEDVLVEGRAHTTARMPCSRCLEPVDIELEGHFQALYVPQDRARELPPRRREQEWGDQRVNFYSEFTLDLAEEIVQTLIIELPMRPLCQPDCAGLCPSCGQNLNDGPCECEPEEDEDLWAPLRDLLPPDEDSDDA